MIVIGRRRLLPAPAGNHYWSAFVHTRWREMNINDQWVSTFAKHPAENY